MDDGRVRVWADKLQRDVGPDKGMLLCHDFADAPEGKGALLLSSRDDFLRAKVVGTLDKLSERHPNVVHVKNVSGLFVTDGGLDFLVHELGVRYICRDFGGLTSYAFVRIPANVPGEQSALLGIMLLTEKSVNACRSRGVFDRYKEVYFYTMDFSERVKELVANVQPGTVCHVYPATMMPGFRDIGTAFITQT